MTDETTAQFMERRERELLARISALRGQLGPMEVELSQVQKMRDLLQSSTVRPDYASGLSAFTSQLTDVAPFAAAPQTSLEILAQNAQHAILQANKAAEIAHYAKLTIKELIVQAIVDNFPNGGTAASIREFIRVGYGRTIEAASFRPQLHRLKADTVLTLDSNDIWNLTLQKRRHYLQYNHPTSRQAMKELQSDEPAQQPGDDDDDYLFRAAAAMAWKPEDEQPDRDGAGPPVNDDATPPSEAERLAQKEAKRARKRGDDFLE